MIYLVTKQPQLFPNTVYSIIPSLIPVIQYLETLDEIAFDSETYGFDPYTKKPIFWQLGDSINQYVVDCSTIDIKELKPIMEAKLLIMQNAQFDLRFCYHYGIYPKKVYDTMLVEALMTAGLGDDTDIKDIMSDCGKKDVALKYADRNLSLEDLALKYLNKQLNKEIRGVIHKEGITDRTVVYSAEDVEVLPSIKRKQLIEWEKFKIRYGIPSDDVLNLENDAVLVFSRELYNGIKLDVPKYKNEIIPRINSTLVNLENKLNNLVIELGINYIKAPGKKSRQIVFTRDLFSQELVSNINWGSPEQKLGVLRNLIPDIKDTKFGTLNVLKEQYPIIKVLLEYNKFSKLQDSFGEKLVNLVNPVTGRLHASIWQILSTGRISMSDPNLAQIPSKGELASLIRSSFIPRSKDYVIVGGDYSQMELRLITEFSQDPLWLTSFNSGEDLHSILASQTFNIPLSDVKKAYPNNPDMTYRDLQKTINFGLAYGMSEFKFSNTAQVSVKEAKETITNFFKKVPKVESFLNSVGNLGRTRGYIKSSAPFGRVRLFPKWFYLQNNPHSRNLESWMGAIERASKNMPFQSTNGDILKLALIKLQEEIDTNNWDVYIILTVYDEIQTECRRDQAEAWKVKMEEIMIEAAKIVIKSIPVKCDVKINEYWSK